MKTCFVLTVTFASLVFASATLAAANPPADGLYQIVGKHSQYGDYTGQARIFQGQVERSIDFKTFRYQSPHRPENFAVDTVWTGTATSEGLEFSLKLSTVLTAFEGFAPSATSLNTPVKVIGHNLQAPAGRLQWQWQVPGESADSVSTPSYDETWVLEGPAPSTPLWRNLREKTEGVGTQKTAVIRLANFVGIQLVVDWYRAQPETLPYRDRPEFKSEMQYFIRDKTDADYYAGHPGTVRLANRTVNPLSLAEALMRRNAYAPTLAEKEQLLRAETLKNNLNSIGMVEIAISDSSGAKVRSQPEYDADIWSAMLGWAEVLRYQTTGDSAALANFKQVLNGLLTAVEITENPSQFARSVAIASQQGDLGEGWHPGKGPFANLLWREGGNNDMFKGILVGLALAHQVPLNDPALLARIQKVARSLPQLEIAKDHGLNEGLAIGLAALWSQDPSLLPGFYLRMNNLRNALSTGLGIEGGIYYGGIADWSGIHLQTVSTLAQILVSAELEKTFAKSPELWRLQKAKSTAQDQMVDLQKSYKPAHRDFITLLAYAFSPKFRASAEFTSEAREALWTLKEVPAPRAVGGGTVNLPMLSDWSLSAWPRVPWKALKGPRKMKSDAKFSDMILGAYSYPHFETLAWGSVYLWKDAPFHTVFSTQPELQFFSADYMFVYWAARHSGLISDKE